MNQLIKNELDNLKVAIVPDYGYDSLEIHFPIGVRTPDKLSFEVGKYYQIELADRLLDPNDETLTLRTQWNNGRIPIDKVLNVEVREIMGKMIRVSGTGANRILPWSGWLPISLVTIKQLL